MVRLREVKENTVLAGSGMKTFIFSVLGAVVFGVLCVVITWVIGAVFGPLYQGEEQANRNFGCFLIAFFMFLLLGAFVGFRLSKKNN